LYTSRNFRTPGPSPEAVALLEGKTVGVIQSLGSYGIFWLIELDDEKIYRKTLYLMVKTMVSCKCSLKPIQ